MAMDWKVALPLHPEYRTLPMVWYVPPQSPITAAAQAGHLGVNGQIPDIASLRVPVKYLANLLTAGKEEPVVDALRKMFAMRIHMRDREVDGRANLKVLEQAGLSQRQVDEMYRYLALADYEDRFVIPTSHREVSEDAYEIKGGCGFSFGNGCSGGGRTEPSLFGSPKKPGHVPVPGKRRAA
jgi:nitrate reductase beta subunit